MTQLWTTHLRSRYQRLADLAQTPIPSETTMQDFRGRTVANPLIVTPLVVGRATIATPTPSPSPVVAAPLPSAPPASPLVSPPVLETLIAPPIAVTTSVSPVSSSSISTLVEPVAMDTSPVETRFEAPKSRTKSFLVLFLIAAVYLLRKNWT